MHELGIVQDVIELVSERSRGARVARVVLEIGALSAVLPDAVRFCFDVASEGTPLAGAMLQIIETPGQARCRACGRTFELLQPFGRCACGGTDLEWLRGEELRIREMEVA
ncbi:MAG TPA: hydrogenase maturation nickel metallochaperone HypA [Myxococcales bacterium]|jgi:hydrogenase nickel incorporation protein HypA/HybF|nr:hydrogenase maturation nickel metallochaperone HypA [Myxococcales bacterium]